MKKLFSGSLILLALTLSSASPAYAHEGNTPQGTEVDCFAHYAFGSVQANVQPATTGTASGIPLSFSGTLTNANDFPIVDGSLYVKIFKTKTAANGTVSNNGPEVVDQFFAQNDISIPAQSSIPMTFTWQVPAGLPSGSYQLATFFTTAHKNNLLGLSFTDDVVGNTTNFDVVGEVTGSVAFDKSSVRINDKPYFFAAFPPSIGTGDAVVTTQVRNTTKTDATVDVNWKLYSWDAQKKENLIVAKTETVLVPAGGSVPTSFKVSDAANPVYLLEASVKNETVSSFLNIRMSRPGINHPRINFPALSAFPLKKDAAATMFSCLHNTAEDTTNAKLVVALFDKDRHEIADYQYTGDIAADMVGTEHSFTPTKNYNYAILSTKLYSGDQLVDSQESIYDCKVLDPKSCVPETPEQAPAPEPESTSPFIPVALGIAFLAALALIGRIIYRRFFTTVAM